MTSLCVDRIPDRRRSKYGSQRSNERGTAKFGEIVRACDQSHFMGGQLRRDQGTIRELAGSNAGVQSLSHWIGGLELVELVRPRKLLIILDGCEYVIKTDALVAEQLNQKAD
jgi:hypothetical protein